MSRRLAWSLVISVTVFALPFIIMVYQGDKPVVLTTGAIVKGSGTVVINGRIEDRGGKEITQYGFKLRDSKSQSLDQEYMLDNNSEQDETFSLIINDLEPGTTYDYQALAANGKGCGLGAIKSFTVPVNAIPVVSISAPGDNTKVTQGEILKIRASAYDDQEIESMNLYINKHLASTVEGNVLTYGWDTSSISPGEYVIKVSADDGSQEELQFITVLVQKKPAITAMAVNDSQPANPEIKTETIPVSRSAEVSNHYQYPHLSKVQGAFGQFYYRDIGGGRIEIDPAWIAENIVTITLPGLNQQVQVHKEAADNFIAAFNYIKNGTTVVNGQQVSLLSLIDSMNGTLVTRHINWDSSRGLSNHSWGIAIDINAGDHFRYVDPGTEPNDPNLILWERAFKPAGFSWGNSYADAMHFELLK